MARHKMSKTGGKKRKSTTGAKKSTRRRRVGASGKLEPILMNGAAVGAGVVAAREASILAGSLFPSLMASPMITGLFQVGLGGVTAYMSKNGFVRFMGLGAMGEGVMTALTATGVIGAPQTMSYSFQNRRQMGDPRLQFVAGPTTRIGSYPNNFGLVAGIGAHRGRKPRYAS
jgi:hypothetical protein